MPESALDTFGQMLMSNVRDEAISDWKMIIDGRMKDESSERVRTTLASLSNAQRDAVLRLIPQVVDTVLHHLLWTLEQTENVNVSVQSNDEFVPSLREASDGLSGELYSDEGWIARYSSETT